MQIYQPGKSRINPSSSNPEESTSTSPSAVRKRVPRYSEKRRAKETSAAAVKTANKEEKEKIEDNL